MVVITHAILTTGEIITAMQKQSIHFIACLWRFIHVLPFSTMRPRQNKRHIPDDIFKCIFLNKNCLKFEYNLTDCVPKDSIHNNYKIGLDIGLVPSRRQAIIWPTGGLGLWRMHASLVLNGLTWKHGMHAIHNNILKVSTIRNHQQIKSNQWISHTTFVCRHN